MSTLVTTKRALLAVTLCCLSVLGQVASAQSADDLMEKIRADRTANQNTAREREGRFRAAMEEKRRLNVEAQQKKSAADVRTTRLDAAFAQNEKEIAELKDLLQVNQGNLGELFGVTRQIAGDVLGQLSESPVNSQLQASAVADSENRLEFMRRMSAASELPSIIELERMWLEIMQEMEAQTEVARFKAPVTIETQTALAKRGEGEEAADVPAAPAELREMDVVRIGPFTTFAEDKYLIYTPSNAGLHMLARQPADDPTLMDYARDITRNTSGTGYMRAAVDPTRSGALLSLYVQRPSFLERIQGGEKVNWIIVAVGILGVVLALFQYGYLIVAKMAVSAQLKKISTPSKGNALGRMLLAVQGSEKEAPDVVELRISEAVLREIPKLERFQSFLRLAVSAGPLLGLIGTVIGMIITFESITASGTSDPKLMAQGIGAAMIATVLGLAIAIPLLFMNSGLVSLSKSIIHVLEEQSTNLMSRVLKQHQ